MKIFRNKKILITGHTGFKGSWLALWLNLLGAKVIGVSNKIITEPSHYKVINLKKEIKEKFIDLSNLKKTSDFIVKTEPDFIFHLAAQALVKKSFLNPYETWISNLNGTLSVLEGLKKLNKKGKKTCTAVLITSDKVYKNLEIDKAYKENDLIGDYDPYSASKASVELLIQSYVKSFFNKDSSKVRIATARAGNVIGGGDWSENRLIPDFVKSWSKKKKLFIRNPNSTRPWQHVLEVLRGYVLLAENLRKNSNLHGENFNFGPTIKNRYTVIKLLKYIKVKFPEINWTIKKNYKKFKEAKLLRLNSNKAKKVLKWKCILSFQQTMDMTLNWYENYYFKRKNIKEYSAKQISDYINIYKKK
jgi:CDP-glucose 4,6-dehydratase